ncbi:hypothetical protein QLX08_007615 [Tetragonisca angustula]|uniref:Uncharacterized protein n=1 Tax=Tetragonisca angustula TaxID=166442 RepID=A0AAW0ZNX2_9HYME
MKESNRVLGSVSQIFVGRESVKKENFFAFTFASCPGEYLVQRAASHASHVVLAHRNSLPTSCPIRLPLFTRRLTVVPTREPRPAEPRPGEHPRTGKTEREKMGKDRAEKTERHGSAGRSTLSRRYVICHVERS